MEYPENIEQIAIENAKHALGFGYKKPYCRHGKKFFKPYRNRFYTKEGGNDFISWEWMRVKGYALRARSSPMSDQFCYWVTAEGRHWLGEILGMKIHPEST